MDKKILQTEQKRLEYAQSLVDKQIDSVNKLIRYCSDDIKDSLHYVNNEKIDDIEKALLYANINEADLNLGYLQKEVETLNKIKPKPFFARIDFVDDFGDNTFYVGLKNIQKEGDYMVLDWRAPISSLLYFSSLGKTTYDTIDRKIGVDLRLKRQFKVSPNVITSYIDTNTKIDDEMLQTVLSQNTSSYMTNIVQTIQEEQNAIIRRSPYQTVIINGVAGSGKTSIAMHRIAYVLYANKGNITSQNVLVISPNRLFSTYIADVLPELGEDNVTSYTMMEVLGVAGLAPKKFGTKVSMIKSQFENEERKRQINKKFSFDFKKEVEEFLSNFDVLPYIKLLNIDDNPITDEELLSIKKNPSKDISFKVEAVINKLLSNRYPRLVGARFDKIQDRLISMCKKNIKPTTIMKELYEKYGLSLGEKDNLGYEDAPIYAYINSYLGNVTRDYHIKHIFVDEMQDYDPFSVELVKRIYPNAVMTLAGDYNQNIVSSQRNLHALKELFPDVGVDNLNVSYRSTNEIVDFANQVIDVNQEPSKLVRHGDEPCVDKCTNSQNLRLYIDKICRKYPNDKIAILTKTEQEAILLKEVCPDFALIKDEEDDGLLTDSHIITTIYLSKGLEYDRVIVPNVNDINFSTELDKQNLYVACTRALHGLYVTFDDRPSKFIPEKYVNRYLPCLETINDKTAKRQDR